MREDLFSLASERQLVERLNEGKYPDYKQLMIDTLKRSYNHEYTGIEELKPLPKQLNCCTPMRSICDTCRKVFICPMQHMERREKCGLYEPLPNPLDEIVNENTTRSLSQIKEENNMEAWEQVEKTRAEAEANAWKDRLIEEYKWTKERYEKLRIANAKAFVRSRTAEERKVSFEEAKKRDTREDLMRGQEHIMRDYIEILERRLILEGIEID